MATEKVTRKTLNDADQRRLVEEALSELDFSEPVLGSVRTTDGGARPGLRSLAVRGRPRAGQARRAARAARPVRRRARRAIASSRCSSSRRTSPRRRSRRRWAALLDGADEILVNFLKLLIENHRMPVIFRIRHEYERLWEEENRTLPVEITSAIALDEETTESLGTDDRRARRAQGHAGRARRPGHPRRHHHQGRQLDPRRLYSQPTGAAAQARCRRA